MIPANISDVQIEEYLQHDYYQKISPYISGKNILDVGCVDHDILDVNKKRLWNHWFIYSVSKSVVGIDIEKNSIQAMKRMGFQAVTMSAEKIIYKNKFDVIFAGEIIEHLPNPGLFLQTAKRALKPKGIIVLSTPNTYSINRFMRVLQLRSNEPPQNIDHTMCFSPKNLETLARKCDLKVTHIDYVYFPFTKETPLIKANKFACRIAGEKFKEQMIVVME